MEQWIEVEAEIILDAFIATDNPNFQKLQAAIVKSLCQYYNWGRNGTLPDEYAS